MLDAGELEQIALELGLSEADLQAARLASTEHLERGRGYLCHGLLDEAIAELQRAAALSPPAPEHQRALGRALVERYASHGLPGARSGRPTSIGRGAAGGA